MTTLPASTRAVAMLGLPLLLLLPQVGDGLFQVRLLRQFAEGDGSLSSDVFLQPLVVLVQLGVGHVLLLAFHPVYLDDAHE